MDNDNDDYAAISVIWKCVQGISQLFFCFLFFFNDVYLIVILFTG